MKVVVVRGFFSRKLRAVLTGIAVALGVALMSGTYILTDTIDHSFASIFTSGAAGRSVVVVPHSARRERRGADGADPRRDAGQGPRRPRRSGRRGEVFSIVSLFDSTASG